MRKRSESLDQTKELAANFLKDLLFQEEQKGRKKGAKVIGLSGDLGSAKTSFVKAIATTLGITETVKSPTFIIEKIYKIPPSVLSGPFQHLIHIDAYRLESPDELTHLGFKEILEDSKNLIFIEWPERVHTILPDGYQLISFRFVDETTRDMEFKK